MARVTTHLSVSELERAYRAAKEATAARHYQAIWLLAKGHTVPEVAETTSFGTRWLEQLLSRYNARGPTALGDQRRHNGRAPSILKPELLERLKPRLATPPWEPRTLTRRPPSQGRPWAVVGGRGPPSAPCVETEPLDGALLRHAGGRWNAGCQPRKASHGHDAADQLGIMFFQSRIDHYILEFYAATGVRHRTKRPDLTVELEPASTLVGDVEALPAKVRREHRPKIPGCDIKVPDHRP